MVKKLYCKKKNELNCKNNMIRIIFDPKLNGYKIFIKNKYFTIIKSNKIIMNYYNNFILPKNLKISKKVYLYYLILRFLREFGFIKTVYNKNDF